MAASRMTRADRAQQLLDLAEDRFTQHGFSAVSIEDIARAAGVTRPVIYQHFGSKDGLFLACARRASRDFEVDLLRAHLASHEDLSGFVRACGRMLFTLLLQRPGRWALLFNNTLVQGSDLGDALLDLRTGTVERIAWLAQRHATELDGERLDAVAHSIAGIAEALSRWHLHSPQADADDLVEHFHTNVMAVITSARRAA